MRAACAEASEKGRHPVGALNLAKLAYDLGLADTVGVGFEIREMDSAGARLEAGLGSAVVPETGDATVPGTGARYF